MNAFASQIAQKPVSLAPVSILGKKRPAETVTAKAASKAAKADGEKQAALIVLGRDEGGRAHAAWFDEADKPLAEIAARLMGLAALGVAADGLRALSGQLPQGRVFASGRAFVPFVRASLFKALAAHLPEGALDAAKAAAADHQAGGADQLTDVESKQQPVLDWSTLRLGHIVLACEKAGEPWYEAVIIEEKQSDIVVLRWRDYEDDPAFIRKRQQLGLLHPNFRSR